MKGDSLKKARIHVDGLEEQGTDQLLARLAGCSEAEVLASLSSGLRGLAADDGVERSATVHHLRHSLLVALELSRRYARERAALVQLRTPAQVFEFLQPQMAGLGREQMHVLCLSSRQKLLRHVCVARGFVDQCAVDAREVWAPALTCRAAGVVLAHNHPSQDPEPSIQDVTLTQQLAQAASLLGIALVDHLVLTDSEFVSLRERGLFQPLTVPHQQWNTRPPC